MFTGKSFLPVTLLAALLLWAAPYLFPIMEPLPPAEDYSPLSALVLQFVSAGWQRPLVFILSLLMLLLLNQIDDRFSLIRERSSAVGSFFLLAASLFTFVQCDVVAVFVTFLFAAAVYSLFAAYNHELPSKPVFTAFFYIGMASLLFPRALCFLPLFFFGMWQAKVLTPKNFHASLLGCLLPYWFLAAYSVLVGRWDLLLALYHNVFAGWLQNYSTITVAQWAAQFTLLFVSVPALFYLMRYYYLDKMQVRRQLTFLLFFELCAVAMALLLPCCFNIGLLLQLIGCSFLTIHYALFSKSRLVPFLFFFSLLLFILIYLFPLWKNLFVFV